LSQGRAPPTAVISEAKESRTRALQKKERAMAMFEGVDRNRNIIIAVAVVVVIIAVFVYLYAGGHLSGII
jgi:hypothetical protein